ncbi:MAG: TetR/AcrR family transcriptional regulator [Deltaproteobacteria bacterium]|jgi:AcrR family transcriptional regulator|nr:TetR/AcrR family transcriptional regulator [Deltaproteobacteria bacterium]
MPQEQTFPSPPERTPSRRTLHAAAVSLFAEKGYDGALVSDIARGAGIRKASVYSGFKSKEDLFLTLLREAMDRETGIVDSALRAGGLSAGLKGYLGSLTGRLAEEPPCLMFLLRSVYMPSAGLREAILALNRVFFPGLLELFRREAAASEVRPENVDAVADACLAVIDSVQAACLYCPDFAGRRISAVWSMFERLVRDC